MKTKSSPLPLTKKDRFSPIFRLLIDFATFLLSRIAAKVDAGTFKSSNKDEMLSPL